MKKRALWLAISIAAVATAVAANAAMRWRTTPAAGVHAYRYESHEVVGGSTKGYQTDFRLRSDGAGGIVAEIVRAATFDGKDWTPVVVDPVCTKAMGASPGELAVVRLAPMTPERAKLGADFLPYCAPAGVFFPLTDILNAVLIPTSHPLGAMTLKNVGRSAAFPGFSTSLDRPDVSMSETSTGGATTLISAQNGQVALDWKPDPAQIHLTERNGGQATQLDGTEHFAFRLVIAARSGLLERADTLYDDLDVTVAVPNAPPDKLPRLAIKRAVSISRTGG